MTFDYRPFIEMGQSLIKEHGRSIKLIRFSTDGLGTIVETKPMYGVFVNPATLERLGFRVSTPDFVATAQQVAIISSPDNLENYHGLIDTDGTTWKVSAIDKLAPGPTPVLWFVGVKQ